MKRESARSRERNKLLQERKRIQWRILGRRRKRHNWAPRKQRNANPRAELALNLFNFVRQYRKLWRGQG